MSQKPRREFLADVGQGMLVASVGATMATELGLATEMRSISRTVSSLNFHVTFPCHS